MVNNNKNSKIIESLKGELSTIKNKLHELHSSSVLSLGEVGMLEKRKREVESSIEEMMKRFEDISA